MLISNLTHVPFTDEQKAFFATLSEEDQEGIRHIRDFAKLQDGIFQIRHWNPEGDYEELPSRSQFWPEVYDKALSFKECWDARGRLLQEQGLPEDFSSYGVCDHPRQVLEKYPSLATCPGKFAITCVRLRKEWEEPGGGWRWHKWGEYIGTQDPQCEYLAHEPVIEEVWTFHIYHIQS